MADPVNELGDLAIDFGVTVMGHLTESEKKLLHRSIVEVCDPFDRVREVEMEGMHSNSNQVVIIVSSLPEGTVQ